MADRQEKRGAAPSRHELADDREIDQVEYRQVIWRQRWVIGVLCAAMMAVSVTKVPEAPVGRNTIRAGVVPALRAFVEGCSWHLPLSMPCALVGVTVEGSRTEAVRYALTVDSILSKKEGGKYEV